MKPHAAVILLAMGLLLGVPLESSQAHAASLSAPEALGECTVGPAKLCLLSLSREPTLFFHGGLELMTTVSDSAQVEDCGITLERVNPPLERR